MKKHASNDVGEIPDSIRIMRIGIGILFLSAGWFLIAPKLKTQSTTIQAPPDVQRRLDAIEAYKKDPSRNTYEYETDTIPPPLAGNKDTVPDEFNQSN